MRYQGKLTTWKSERGFGFVTRNGTGEKTFVHITAFSERMRKPVEGDLITYEQVLDENHRFRADKVRFAGNGQAATSDSTQSWFGTGFAALFCCLLVLLTLAGKLPLAVIGIYGVASTAAFSAYAIDKSAAKHGMWRTQEATLHLFGLIGGWPGALLAQKLFRHKSKKVEFQTVYWATVFLNCCALGWLLSTSGSAFMRSIQNFAA